METPQPATPTSALSNTSTATPPHETAQPWWKDSTVFGVLLGSIFTIAAQYFITYVGIEKPKIEIEKIKANTELKKISVEAHKQALALTPTVTSLCGARVIDPWTIKLNCSTKNTGQYHAYIKVDDVSLTLASDTKEVIYKQGQGFWLEYPNGKNMFLSSPSSEGDLWFYVKFDRNKYPNGYSLTSVVPRVSLSYSTLDEAQKFVAAQFPDLKDMIAKISNRSTTILVEVQQ